MVGTQRAASRLAVAAACTRAAALGGNGRPVGRGPAWANVAEDAARQANMTQLGAELGAC